MAVEEINIGTQAAELNLRLRQGNSTDRLPLRMNQGEAIVQSGTTSDATELITGLDDTSVLAVGMLVEGAGVPEGRTIASINSSSQVTMSGNGDVTGTADLTFRTLMDITDHKFILRATRLGKQVLRKSTDDGDGLTIEDGASGTLYLEGWSAEETRDLPATEPFPSTSPEDQKIAKIVYELEMRYNDQQRTWIKGLIKVDPGANDEEPYA